MHDDRVASVPGTPEEVEASYTRAVDFINRRCLVKIRHVWEDYHNHDEHESEMHIMLCPGEGGCLQRLLTIMSVIKNPQDAIRTFLNDAPPLGSKLPFRVRGSMGFDDIRRIELPPSLINK